MKRNSIFLCGLASIMIVGCSNSNELKMENESLVVQIESLSAEKERLSSVGESLSSELDFEKKRADSLQQSIVKIEEEASVQTSDVSVVLTDKGAEAGQYSQLYCPLVFDVTNNTDKDIQGVQGSLKICDLFGKEIMTIGCDFTGQVISVGQTVTEDKLEYSVNQFIDTDMKFYNTAYNDLQFSYNVSQIVFTDGSVKK